MGHVALCSCGWFSSVPQFLQVYVAHKVPIPLDYTAAPWQFLSDIAVNVKSQMIMIFISFFIYAQKWDCWILWDSIFVNVAPPGQATLWTHSAIWLLVSRRWK